MLRVFGWLRLEFFFSMTGFLVAATLVESKWHLEVKSMASQWTMKEQCFEADVIRLSLFNVFFFKIWFANVFFLDIRKLEGKMKVSCCQS